MTETLNVPKIQWNSPVKNFTEVQGAWGGAIDVAGWWINLFGDIAVNKKLKESLAAAAAEAMESVSWTGTGVLLWIRVVRIQHQDTPIRVTAILGDGPMQLALGRDPADALFNYLGSDRVTADAPEGWVFDEAASYYIWVSNESPNGVALPKGTIRDLTDEVKGRFGEMAIRKFTETFETGDILNRIVRRAKQDIVEQNAKNAIDGALQLVRDSQQRVLAIQKELKKASDTAAKAAQTTMLLSTLQGILSLAQLTELAVCELGSDPTKFANATKVSDVLATSNQIMADAETAKVNYSGAFSGGVLEFKNYLDLLRERISEQVQPPASVNQYLKR